LATSKRFKLAVFEEQSIKETKDNFFALEVAKKQGFPNRFWCENKWNSILTLEQNLYK